MLKAVRGALFAALLVAVDQLTKHLAVAGLYKSKRGSIELIPGVLSLQYLENRGAAFGLMQNRTWIFVLFAALVIGAGSYMYLKCPSGRHYLPLRLCIAALAAGALGNLIDRLARGYVVDFIYFSIINFPIFNVADICVSVSVTILLVLILFVYKEDELTHMIRKDEKKGHAAALDETGRKEDNHE